MSFLNIEILTIPLPVFVILAIPLLLLLGFLGVLLYFIICPLTYQEGLAWFMIKRKAPTRWTSSEVKRLLPYVRVGVLLHERTLKGHLSDRGARHAMVSAFYDGCIYELRFTLTAIAKALNDKKPLEFTDWRHMGIFP